VNILFIRKLSGFVFICFFFFTFVNCISSGSLYKEKNQFISLDQKDSMSYTPDMKVEIDAGVLGVTSGGVSVHAFVHAEPDENDDSVLKLMPMPIDNWVHRPFEGGNFEAHDFNATTMVSGGPLYFFIATQGSIPTSSYFVLQLCMYDDLPGVLVNRELWLDRHGLPGTGRQTEHDRQVLASGTYFNASGPRHPAAFYHAMRGLSDGESFRVELPGIQEGKSIRMRLLIVVTDPMYPAHIDVAATVAWNVEVAAGGAGAAGRVV
jgi:hypothetical protein